MKPTVTTLLGLLLTCLPGLVPQADAQTRYSRTPYGGPAPNGITEQVPWVVNQSVAEPGEKGTPFGPRYRMYGQFGEGVGYTDSFASVGVFLPYHIDPYTDLVFLDGRAFGGDEDSMGANIGVGYRRVVGSAIVGGSLWGDLVTIEETHYRAGVSGEVIFPWFEFRANAYHGLGEQNRELFVESTGTPAFFENFIVFERRAQAEMQYSGFDAEIGGPLPLFGFESLYAYVGGYHLDSDGGDSGTGVRVRTESHVSENIQVGLQVNHDPIFDTTIAATLALQFPESPPNEWFRRKWFQRRTLENHLGRQVERQYRIPVRSGMMVGRTPAINPDDGEPIRVVHIDPAIAGGGTGTFEDPFGQNTFANDPSTDIIRVLPGTLATAGSLTLFDRQRLLSATFDHSVTAVGGTFALPGQVAGTTTLTNTLGGNTVVLANLNEVSGFTMVGTGNGVFGMGITGFNVNRNTFNGLTDGVFLQNAGTGTITGNTFAGNGNGVHLVSAGGQTTNATISTNTFTGQTGSGVLAEAMGNALPTPVAPSPAASVVADIDGNTFAGNQNMGVRGVASGTNSDVRLNVGTTAGNTFTGDFDAAIGLFAQDLSTATLVAQNNTITGVVDNVMPAAPNSPQGDGIFLSRTGSAVLTGVLGDGIAGNGLGGNTITNVAGSGVNFVAGGSDSNTVPFGVPLRTPSFLHADDNTLTTLGNSGFRFDLFADAEVQAVVVNNDITGATGNGTGVQGGIAWQTANNSSFGLPNRPATGEDRNNDGILQPWEDINRDGVLDTNRTVLSSVFDSNRIADSINGISGLAFTSNAALGPSSSFTDVRISGTLLDAAGNRLRTTITNSTVDGISLVNNSNEVVTNEGPASNYVVQGTDISGSGAVGMDFSITAGTKSKPFRIGGPLPGQNVNVTGSGAEGIRVATTGGASTFVLNNVASNGNGTDGLFVNHAAGNLRFNVTGSQFNDNGAIGAEIAITSTGVARFNFGNEDASFSAGAQSPNGVINGYVVNDGTIASVLSTYEDVNRNGILDPGEDVNFNGILDFNEDVNGDGMLADVGNQFNNNGAQGFYFQTTGTGAFRPPDDVPGENTTPPATAGGGYADSQMPRAAGSAFGGDSFVVNSRLNFYGNQVLFNGNTTRNQVDGMVLAVGTFTNQIASVANNTFGGNVLSDFRTVVLNTSTPPAGIDDVPNTDPVQDRVFYDPIGQLDLAFGQNFVGPAPGTRGARSIPTNGNAGNRGDLINISTMGSATSLFGRTENGVFETGDYVRAAGRSAFMVLNVYNANANSLDDVSRGGSGNPGNLFTQQTGNMPILNAFQNANNNIGGLPTPALNPNFNTVNIVNGLPLP